MVDKRIRIILDSSGAKKNADDLNRSLVGVGKSADNSVFSMNRLAAAIAGVISTQKVIEYADAWTNVQNQLRRTTDSQEQLIATSAQLLKVSNDTRSDLEVTAQLYTSLSVSTESLGLSQERVIGVTRTINNLFLEAGKSAAETSGAVRQLGQALESGALRGDEFNSVAEGAPGILRAIQKQTGLTRAELRDLAADGKITAELIVSSLEGYSEAAETAASKVTRSFSQSTTIARNNAIAFVGASDGITKAVSFAGQGIVRLSENLESLMTIAGAAAALYVARLIPAVTSSVVATIEANKAAAARAAAEQSQATAIARRASVEASATLVTLESTRADLAAANAKVAVARQLSAQTGATAFLNYTLAQQKIAQDAVNIATVNAANAASAASAANVRLSAANSAVAATATLAGRTLGVLRGALAFIGGPLGAAFLAASAILYFGSSSEKAAPQVDQLTASTEGLTEAQKELRRLEIGKAIQEQADIIADANKKIAFNQDIIDKQRLSAEGIKIANEQIIIQRARLDDANQAAQKLNDTLANLSKPSKGKKTGGNGTTFVEPSESNVGDDINKEIDARIEATRKAAEAAQDEIRGAQSVTAALRMELETRQKISQFYRQAQLAENQGYFEQERAMLYAQEQERIALINQRQAEDAQRREEQLRQALEHENLTETQKAEIRRAYDEQALEAARVYQQQETAILEEGVQTRKQIDEMEKAARMQSFADLGAALLALGQGQSRKVFEVGKALSLAQAAVSLPAAVIKSYQNAGGYPWGIPAAAAMTAAGLKQIQMIRNARFGSGAGGAASSGGGGGSVGGPAGDLPTTNSNQPQFEQKRVIEVRGVSPDSLITGQQLADILSSDDNVIVQLNNAQQDAQRRGVIT